MRLCIGVIARILYFCASKGTTKKDVVEALVNAVDPESIYDIDSTTVTRIFNCTSALKPANNRAKTSSKRFIDVVPKSKNASLKAVSNEIESRVKILFVADKIDLLISLLLDIVENDTVIDSENSKSFEQYVGKTKEKLLEDDDYNFSELLAGLCLYSLSVVENSVGRGCDNENKPCAVSVAAKSAYQHNDKNGNIKDEYKQALTKAVAECGKPCVLCITEDYISSFNGKNRKQRVNTFCEYREQARDENSTKTYSDEDTTRFIVMSYEQNKHCLKCNKPFEYTSDNDGKLSGVLGEPVTAPNGITFLLCPNCKAKIKYEPRDVLNELANTKQQYLENDKLIDNAQRYINPEDIEKLMRELTTLIDSSKSDINLLKPLDSLCNYETDTKTPIVNIPAKPSDKIPPSPLESMVSGLVNYCYGAVNDIIENIKDENISKADNIRPCIHQAYLNLKGKDRTQSQIFYGLVDVLRELTGNRYSIEAYQTVIAYFVPQCSVFDRIGEEVQ